MTDDKPGVVGSMKYVCRSCGGHCELHTSGAVLGPTYAVICPIDGCNDALFIVEADE